VSDNGDIPLFDLDQDQDQDYPETSKDINDNTINDVKILNF